MPMSFPKFCDHNMYLYDEIQLLDLLEMVLIIKTVN